MIRVLTYNIHKGFDSGNRRFTLRAIRRAIERTRADLVFLQEVLGHHEEHASRVVRWPTVSQFEYLADRLWPHFAYGKNAVYTAGHHGNAILSRYPFSFWENEDVSMNQLERRGLLHATIEIPHHPNPVHVICVHLGLLESDRAAQARVIAKRINQWVGPHHPLIIGGDFNDWRKKLSPIFRKELGMMDAYASLYGKYPLTFPSWLPALSLDRIYVRGLKPMLARCISEPPWSRLSDHLAVYAELDFLGSSSSIGMEGEGGTPTARRTAWSS